MATTYNFQQLESLWIQAGGPTVVAPLMAEIALLESSGNPEALNPTDNGGTQSSFGLWQISTGNHTPFDPNWDDPLTNAKAAVAKYESQGLGAWGTAQQAIKNLESRGTNVSSMLGGSSGGSYSGAVSTVTAGPWPVTIQRAVVVICVLLLAWFLVGAFRRS